jgi:choline dehydrogenase
MDTTKLPDYVGTVVIGAGTSGCSFTHVHALNSSDDLLLLEAGPDYGARWSGRWPADVLDAKSIPLSHDWHITGLGSAGSVRDLPRARIVGGCSAHNGCTIARSARTDYDQWAALGNPGWDAVTVEPILDWAHARFRTSRYLMRELTSAHAAFVRAGIEAGLPFADNLDDMDAGIGIGPMPMNIVDGVRFNASFAFLDAVRGLAHVDVVGEAAVSRILIEAGRAIGVQICTADGAPRVVRAERVVLTAGAYHSPVLLQRSGVGRANYLHALGLSPSIDLPGVGEHLLDHACIPMHFNGKNGLLDELARTRWNPDEQSIGRARSSRCDDGPYDMHLFMVAGANSGHPGMPPVSLYGSAMCATSQGRVSITSADGTIGIDHRYGTDPDGHDQTVLAEAGELLATMTRQPELAAILGSRVHRDSPPMADIASYGHPAGTCMMGHDPNGGAVVDATGQVYGVTGLYVADASVMPTITRGNINLPTAMIGAHIAARLLTVALDDVVGVSQLSSAIERSIP